MARLSLLAVILALALALAPANAFWILSHHPLISERLDMIVSPGALSGHTHTFVGSAAVTIGQNGSDYCTTSPVKADLSNYWTPQLYYYHGNSSTFDSVPLASVNTYYLNRGGPIMGENSSLLHPFPKGLKMLAGSAVNYDAPLADATAAKAISFVCLNYTSGGGSPQTTTLPSGPCLDGMRAQIIFPSCWDGVNLDSSNHQSHLSYPVNGQPDTGDCPSSHPVKFMTLFYEFIYDTGSLQSISNGTSSSGFVFANGDAVGYSFHGDFVSNWDQEVLTDAIDQCSGNLFGDLDACEPFLPTLHYETTTPDSDADAGYCTTTASVNEKVLGTGFTALPNCQVVHNGPFKGAGSCGNTTQVVPTITVVSNSTAPDHADYQGCYQDPTGGRALKTKLTSLTASKMTIEMCQAGCTSAGYSVAGLQYADECWCGNSFTHGTTKLKDEFCNMACAGNSTEMCGSGNINSVYSSAAVVTLANPVIPATAGSASYWGCYLDGGSRLLKSASYANSSVTPTQCAAYCTAKGYAFSGTEYADECYCGTSTMMQSATLEPDSGCNMLCAGNATAYCGGSNRLQIYSALTNPNATTSNSSTSTSSSSTSKSSSTPATSSATSGTSSSTSATSSSTATSGSSTTMVMTMTISGTTTVMTTVVQANAAVATAPTAATSTVSATSSSTTSKSSSSSSSSSSALSSSSSSKSSSSSTSAPSSSSTSKSSSTSALSSSSSSKTSSSTSKSSSSSTKTSSTTEVILSTTVVRITSTSTGLHTTKTTTRTTTSTITKTTVVPVANGNGIAIPTSTSSSSTSSSSTKKTSSSTKKTSSSTKKSSSSSTKKRARSLPTRLPADEA